MQTILIVYTDTHMMLTVVGNACRPVRPPQNEPLVDRRKMSRSHHSYVLYFWAPWIRTYIFACRICDFMLRFSFCFSFEYMCTKIYFSEKFLRKHIYTFCMILFQFVGYYLTQNWLRDIHGISTVSKIPFFLSKI